MIFSNQARILLTNKRHRSQNRRASLSIVFFQKTATQNYFKAEQALCKSNYLLRF